MQRARSFDGDLRALIQTLPMRRRERPEREAPEVRPVPLPGTIPADGSPGEPVPSGAGIPLAASAPAPGPVASFDGLDFATWGAGHPPDTNGDVGPTYYIETINTSIGIYDKASGVRVAAFTFNTFMSQGNFGNLCDTNNFGDPVVLYDTFEDRWVITDFAFSLDASANVINPPGAFQCFAVSKSGDPVSGGWNFYSVNTTGGLGDYPKLGIWPDGLYMSVNIFDYSAAGSFQNVRLYALNKAQMYAGDPSIQVVSFDAPPSEFTLLPANARLQTGTPPAGSPNYFASVWNYLNVVGVWKFHVDWNHISTSTLTGPFNSITSNNWSQLTSGTVPSPANPIDTLHPRLMMQNQYTNLGGVESLWDSHSAGASGATSTQAAVRYYQVNVTGGSVAATATQAFTYAPDATLHRFLPSVAIDRVGNLAIGYSTSSSTQNPAIRYAGRLAADPVNTISQTETVLFQGTGSQSGTCGGATCARWGDYSAMTLAPDGCTFWYANEYYQVTGLNNRTRISAFSLPGCATIGSGALQGTVKTTASVPIAGATVALGSRTAITDASGNYSFTDLPAGTYPGMTASAPGFDPAQLADVAVPDGGTATQNFVLGAAPVSGCLTDTTQSDFQAGIPTNCDLTGSPDNLTLVNPTSLDQQNLTVTGSGFGITATSWGGQTFTPAVTGQLTRVDLDLFCSGCTGTTPNLTVSIRATTGGTPIPTGADLAVATIAGFSSGAGGMFTANFAIPATLTAGTRYAVIVRPVANPSPGLYAYVCSCAGTSGVNSNPYLTGQRVTSANSGGAWTADTTTGGRDLGFVTYMQAGFAASGNFVSSTKDANPAAGGAAAWSSLAWTASVPAGTTLRFQAAASDNVNGPFTFVGPDGTAGTFFSNGGSLSQFNGHRYLKYQALLTTSNGGVAPAINDVTVCFANVPPIAATTLAMSTAAGTYGGAANLSATLTSSGSGVSGQSIAFTLNGNSVGSGLTNASGVATVAGVSLAGVNAGTYPGAVAASFAGDAGYAASSGSNSLTVDRANQAITFGALAGKTFGDPDFLVSATASSGLAVSFAASGTCTIAGNTVHITGAGSCTITASQPGDANYNAAPDVARTFAIALSPEVVAQALLAGANRLGPPLQHADGGWYFLASATSCGIPPLLPGLPPPSCPNLFGINGLGLLEAYRHNPSNQFLLDHARAAGEALVARFQAEDPLAHSWPIMQDVEFLGALAQTSGNPAYMTVATNWFAVLVAQFPSAASRIDTIFAGRDADGFRTFGAWDAASLIRAARGVGNVAYATAAANRVVERELDRVEGGLPLAGWQYTNPAAVPPDNPYGYDDTMLAEGSLLGSIFDLPGFEAKRDEYRDFLLAQQDPGGTWNGGDLQMTAYIAKGLIALGDSTAAGAIARAESFFADHQLANGGWPFYIAGAKTGNEYTEVDSEVMQALSALYNTPAGANVATQPSPLAALRFSTVTAVGTTTVTAIDPATSGSVPSGYALAALGYAASTTAALGRSLSDGITVCLWAPAISDPAVFANLRVMHNEGGTLVDRTILAPDPKAPDFATRTICARVGSLGPFALAVIHEKPPKVTAPKRIVKEATSRFGAVVTFGASAIDPVDGVLPVTCVPASGSMFPLGDTAVACTATNAAGMSDEARLTVRIRDTVAPAIVSLTPSVSTLPPGGGRVPVTIAVVVQDAVDPAPVCAVKRVTSNVKDGDRNHVPDWMITGPLSVSLESATGKHRGRRYTITVGCRDASGNASSDKTTVVFSPQGLAP